MPLLLKVPALFNCLWRRFAAAGLETRTPEIQEALSAVVEWRNTDPAPGLGTETGPAGPLFRNCDVSVCRSVARDTRTGISIKAVVLVEWSQFAGHLSMAFKVRHSVVPPRRSTRVCIVSAVRLTRSSDSFTV
jgi:hypothetical protein